jgi:hypothetical protein
VTLLAQHHTVLLLHHFGKDASRGSRGWSGLGAALDFEWEINRTDDLRTLHVSKMRDGSDTLPALCYRFRGRQLGVDQYGDEVTAVVVEHLADADPGKRNRLSPAGRALVNKLWEMIKDPAQSFPLPDGSGLRCVLLNDLEAECIKEGVISKTKRERDRLRLFKDTLAELRLARTVSDDGTGRIYPQPAAKRGI